MLTATEIVFIKELIEQLSSLSEPSDYTLKEVEVAMELLNRLEPIDTEKFLKFSEEELAPSYHK